MKHREWKAVPGWEGFYEVSNDGLVRSCERIVIDRTKRKRRYKGKQLKATPNDRGYPFVLLRNGNTRTARRVGIHQLVAAAFVGPMPEGCDRVCHLNDDRTDNRAENIVYGNASTNGHHAVKNGRHYEANKTACDHGHEYVEGSHSVRRKLNTVYRVCLVCKRIDTNERRRRERERRAS